MPFEAFYPFVDVKLPHNIVTVGMPPITSTEQTNFQENEIRITEDGETRITEDGETRILDAFDISSYPEVTPVKLFGNIINVRVP